MTNLTPPHSPVLISLVRKAMPAILANSIIGVSPMTGPTGSVFSMRTRYGLLDQTYSYEYHYNEESRFKPYWLELYSERAGHDNRVPVMFDHLAWTKYISVKLEEMLGPQGESNNFRWSLRARPEVVLTFKSNADMVLFLLWFKGQTGETLQELDSI